MKKFVFLIVLVLLFIPAQAEMLTYVGGQAIVDGNKTDGIGGGMVMAWGIQVSDRIITWVNYDGFKTEEADDYDHGLFGISYLTPDVIPQWHVGFFVNAEAGIGKMETEPAEFASAANIGFYMNVTPKMRIWLGGNYKNTAGNTQVYSVMLGTSVPISFK